MSRRSAGLLLYRWRHGRLQVFLVHPGGPFWAGKDQHAWSFPKGEHDESEDALTAAKREVLEETGLAPEGRFLALDPVRQPGGKLIRAWAVEADADPAAIRSNSFTMEWPPRSGRQQSFPEVDRAGWFDLAEARDKLHKGQVPVIDALATLLSGDAKG